MPMDYISSLTTLFGADATITGTGTNAVLSFKPSQTGVDSNFGTPQTARPEAIVLALLQKVFAAQGVTANRAMEVTKTSVLGTKDNAQVSGEQYIVRIFSASALSGLDPDTL